MNDNELNTNCWQSADLSNPELRLGETEIHVWLAPLACEDYKEAEKILSDDERARAEKFRFRPDREKYLAARCFLRRALGVYLETAPEMIRFGFGEFGKPFLAGAAKLHFNLSHSGEYVVLALTEIGEIGIDLEFVEPKFVDENSARQILTREEIKRLFERPEGERAGLYFDYWTRKEAYLKMRGDGLMLEPNKIDINSVIESQNKRSKPELRFFNLPFIVGYSSALTVENESLKSDVRLICLKSL